MNPSGADEPAAGDQIPPPEPSYQRFDCTIDDPVALAAATEAARRAVERGECIVMPTDTVYGIGADAFDPDAVQRLLDAKMRGRDMPPPVLIADPSLIRALASDVPEPAKELIDQHWPGPLTIIVKRQPSLRMDLGDSEGTVALRVPDHELTRDILRGTGPMAVSSANLSGQPAAVTCDEAIAQLADDVAVYLDGGPVGSADSASSTIVDFTRRPTGQVLRHGALSVEVLRATCPALEDLVEEVVADPAPVEELTPAPTPEDRDDVVEAEFAEVAEGTEVAQGTEVRPQRPGDAVGESQGTPEPAPRAGGAEQESRT